MSGYRLKLVLALSGVVLATALGAWAAGAPPGAAALGGLAGGVAALAGRAWVERALTASLAAADRRSATLEDRVRASEARRTRLEAVIEAMEEAVLVVDSEERVLLANPRLREIFSAPGVPGPLEGSSLLEAVRHTEVVDGLRAALRKSQTQVREAAIGPAGERRVRFHVAPFAQPDGAPGAVAVFHDVTELRRVESVRRDFVANASHELKTPLTSIRGYAERLADQKLPEAAVHAVEAILANAKRLGALVEDLLELSRIESGSIPLHLEEVSAAELARRLLRDLEPRLRAGQLAAAVEVEGDGCVRADRRALEQILGNLLDNAIKYTAAGGGVRVRLGPGASRRLQLVVEDTGIGIPRKDLPRIFERFYRVDPGRSRALGGTGLGLAIVKHLVQAMGGQLGVESQPGKGSRFWVELPRSGA